MVTKHKVISLDANEGIYGKVRAISVSIMCVHDFTKFKVYCKWGKIYWAKISRFSRVSRAP